MLNRRVHHQPHALLPLDKTLVNKKLLPRSGLDSRELLGE
jgi:hypothetical protein